MGFPIDISAAWEPQPKGSYSMRRAVPSNVTMMMNDDDHDGDDDDDDSIKVLIFVNNY